MNITFEIEYFTRWGESLSLLSGGREYPMKWNPGGIWSVSIDDCSKQLLEDYTYAVFENGIVTRTEWSRHNNPIAERIRDKWIECPFRWAGTAVPLFSLRSRDDFGIGDFRDLRLLVDWASATGQRIIQLLPINDTTRNWGWDDAFPYSPISAFALNPIYIRLQDLGIEEDNSFRKFQKELNSLETIDFPKVSKAKLKYLQQAWKKRGAKDTASEEFRKFCKDNDTWLKDYCNFCATRDENEPQFYAWVQFHLDLQFAEEVAYARAKGIRLKGDLPIGVSRDSVECHCHPELFNLDSNAGAPPDRFSKSGQNWGFPTYNWEAMSREDFRWWKARLRKMAEYFDAFRIDHILGFFRIWEIPAECKSGLDGHFNPALSYTSDEIAKARLPLDGLFHPDPREEGMYQPLFKPTAKRLTKKQKERFQTLHDDFFYHRNDAFWRENAMQKLPALLSATNMLPCGEDLGLVPDCVAEVMERLGILSLHMRTMEGPGAWKEKSVCATSSHDMETLRMQSPTDPSGEACQMILNEYLNSPSVLAIFPIQDWLAIDEDLRRKNRDEERINDPASAHNRWCYRLHFPLELLTDGTADTLNALIERMLKDSGRR